MTLSSIALIGVPAAAADEQQATAEQNTAAKPSVIINEVYAGNTKAAGDPDSKRCDWVELKNTGSTDVDVKGWGIYDSGKKAKKHYTIGTSEVTNTDTVIKAGGYLVAYIDPDKAKPAKTCDAAPDMKVSSIKSDNLIVTILATSNCDDKNASTKFNDSATRLTLQDSDDNVVADAVFDFSGDNAKTISGDTGTKIKVSYASSQYYRPANEIGANPSDLSVKSVTGSDKGAGAAASSDSGVISGSNVTDDEAEIMQARHWIGRSSTTRTPQSCSIPRIPHSCPASVRVWRLKARPGTTAIFLRNSSRCTTRIQTYCLSGRVTGPPTAAIPTNTM